MFFSPSSNYSVSVTLSKFPGNRPALEFSGDNAPIVTAHDVACGYCTIDAPVGSLNNLRWFKVEIDNFNSIEKFLDALSKKPGFDLCVQNARKELNKYYEQKPGFTLKK